MGYPYPYFCLCAKSGLGFGVQGLGFGFRVYGLGFGSLLDQLSPVWGLGFA